MKNKVRFILGLLLIAAIVLIIFIFLIFSRSSNFLRPIFGENLKTKLVQELSSKKIELRVLPDELDDALVTSVSGVLVYFSKEKDLSGQVTALQMILGKITIDNRVPKEIDLRFSKPILRY